EMTRTPTETPVPVPTMTLQPITPLPTLVVSVYTYCWEGPSEQFPIVAIVFPGDTFTPEGKTPTGSWWYVPTPRQHRKLPIDHCWLYSGSTVLTGDPSVLPVVPTPSMATVVPGG
ncbi:MAG TPA: hypothetical protein VF813_06170, partial [Anaerolineaceae bacterium]